MLTKPKKIKKKMPPSTTVPVTVDFMGFCNFCEHKMVEDRKHSAEEMWAIIEAHGHYTKCVGKIGKMLMCQDCYNDLDDIVHKMCTRRDADTE